MDKDPIKLALWAMLVGNIEDMGILPIIQAGEKIAECLDDATPLERFAQYDGADNMEVSEKNGFTYIVLTHCPYSDVYKQIPPWGDRATKLVEAYNKSKRDDAGGALHPLCLVHKGIRSALKDQMFSLGCRCEETGRIEIADRALEKVSITREEALAMLEGKACLYAIKSA